MEPGGTLLCAIDCDPRASGLVACARQWAAATGLRARFVHACAPRAPEGATAAESQAEAVRRDLALAHHELRVLTGDPAVAVLDVVRAEAPALVLVASAAGEDGQLGAVCSALLRGAGRPVAVLPPGGEASFSGGPIVCALSVGHGDEAAVRFAGALAAASGRRLALMHVVGAKDAARLAAARVGGSLTGEPAAGLAPRRLAQRLVEVARDAAADALVVASRPQDAAADGLLSSRARRLWTAAPCPVVVVHA